MKYRKYYFLNSFFCNFCNQFCKNLFLDLSVGVGGDLVQFNAEGDGFGKYDIFQYQQTSRGVYKYVRIGDWADRSVESTS